VTRIVMFAVAVLVPLGVIFLASRMESAERWRVHAQHVALAQWQETGKAVPGWAKHWLWASDMADGEDAEQVADEVLCESCRLRPADKRVRLGSALFAVCSGCAPMREVAAK
jgi:hypothetical protein